MFVCLLCFVHVPCCSFFVFNFRFESLVIVSGVVVVVVVVEDIVS